tara:strand:+ start:1790 stop:2704 length:915 start_codon:yes stop_codon:yes gene_type:complete
MAADISKSTVLRDLIVHVESESKKEITYGSLTLHTPEYATQFNEFDNRNAYGEVVACGNYNDVNVGDTVWFHHNIVMNQTNSMTMAKTNKNASHKYRLDADKNLFLVPYSEDEMSLNCMAYLKQDANTKEYKALNAFVFGKPVEKEELEERSGLIIRNQHEYGFALECSVEYVSDYSKTFGIKEGDVVGVTNNADYKMDVNGEDLWRFPYYSIAYILRDEEFIPFNNNVIIKADEKEAKIGSFQLSHTYVKEQTKATVIAVGDGCDELEVGDRIVHENKMMYNLYSKYGSEYYILREVNVIGVI